MNKYSKKLITICAIVVTYNRKYLLTECLDALLKQSHPLDSIIIVDNASTDRTYEYLFEKGFLYNKTIDYVFLEFNTGGSGGFNHGIRRAYEKGFDWVWLMDDDVIADEQALECLLLSIDILPKDVGFLCSNVFGIDGQPMNLPQIDMRLGNNNYPQWNYYLSHGVIKVKEATFVSVLIPRCVIEIVGLPIKEFFIWGDDAEYTNRITDAFPGFLIGSSTVCHKRAIQKRIDLNDEDNINRINLFYYKYRNMFYLYKKYNGLRRAFLYFLKHGIVMTFQVIKYPYFRFLKINKMYKGILSGIFFNPKIEYVK